MSDVKIVVSAEGAESEAVLKAVTDAVANLGAQVKTVAEDAKKQKDAFQAMGKQWGKAWHDISETANNSLELIKEGINGLRSSYDILREGADLSEAQQNFRAYAASVGKDSDELMRKMRQASKNQISDVDLMQSAIKAMRLGVTKDAGTIAKLLTVADEKGALFGRSTKETFDTMVNAISKGQGRALIELGVLPESFGKAGNAADLLKNRVLLLKKVLQEGRADIQALAGVGPLAFDDFNQFEASVANVTDKLKILLSDAAKPLVSQLLEGTVPAVNSAVDSLREWTKANLENKDKLQEHVETLGSVKSAVEYAIAAYAGWKLGAMVESLVIMTTALRNMTKAQLAANAAALANPYVLAGAAIAGSALNLYGKYSDYKDAANADDYAAQKNKELRGMGPAGQARAEIVDLENKLQKLRDDLARTTQGISGKSDEWAEKQRGGSLSDKVNQNYIDTIEKMAHSQARLQAEISETEQRLTGVRDKLKEIKSANEEIKKPSATTSPEAPPPVDENNFEDIITGAEDAEKAMKKLREEALKAQQNLFDTLLSNFKKELTAISNLEDPLVKYFEAAELAEKTTLSLAAAVGTVTGGGATSLYQALSGVKDAAFNAEESMFDLFQRSKQEAEDASKSIKELKAAYELVQKSNVMLWNNTTGMEFSVAAANWFSGGLLTAQGGSAKDSVKDLKEPLSKTIADAVAAGFANADFSSLELTLGSILSSVLSKSVATSNPVVDAATGAVNWGNLGVNLAVNAATKVLTQPGRFFGGREEHGKEAIQQASDLKGRMGQAYVDSFVSEMTSVFAGKAMRDAIANARFGYYGTSIGYTWNDSGNGWTSDRTRTYALADNGASAALKKLTDAVKDAEIFSENREAWINLQAAKGYEYSALKDKVAAYESASSYYGEASLKWTDGSVNQGENLTKLTYEIQSTLAEMVRELGAATAARFTAAASGFSKYAPWLDNIYMRNQRSEQSFSGNGIFSPVVRGIPMPGFDGYSASVDGLSRDQYYDAFEKLQNDFADRNISTGLLDIVKESGSGRYELEKLRVTGSEDYAEAYADYLDKQISAIEEVMERQEEIFKDATRTFEERSAALANYEAAQDSYYQAKLDALAAEQAAEAAIKQKQQEADLRKAEGMEAALSLVGEVAQRGDKIVILQGGDSTAALKTLLEKFQDDPSVAAILTAAISENEAKARWGN
jgi:hypothetical protein